MPEKYEATPKESPTVFPVEDRNTGLLDKDGNPIMAGANPMGFLAEIET